MSEGNDELVTIDDLPMVQEQCAEQGSVQPLERAIVSLIERLSWKETVRLFDADEVYALAYESPPCPASILDALVERAASTEDDNEKAERICFLARLCSLRRAGVIADQADYKLEVVAHLAKQLELFRQWSALGGRSGAASLWLVASLRGMDAHETDADLFTSALEDERPADEQALIALALSTWRDVPRMMGGAKLLRHGLTIANARRGVAFSDARASQALVDTLGSSDALPAWYWFRDFSHAEGKLGISALCVWVLNQVEDVNLDVVVRAIASSEGYVSIPEMQFLEERVFNTIPDYGLDPRHLTEMQRLVLGRMGRFDYYGTVDFRRTIGVGHKSDELIELLEEAGPWAAHDYELNGERHTSSLVRIWQRACGETLPMSVARDMVQHCDVRALLGLLRSNFTALRFRTGDETSWVERDIELLQLALPRVGETSAGQLAAVSVDSKCPRAGGRAGALAALSGLVDGNVSIDELNLKDFSLELRIFGPKLSPIAKLIKRLPQSIREQLDLETMK